MKTAFKSVAVDIKCVMERGGHPVLIKTQTRWKLSTKHWAVSLIARRCRAWPRIAAGVPHRRITKTTRASTQGRERPKLRIIQCSLRVPISSEYVLICAIYALAKWASSTNEASRYMFSHMNNGSWRAVWEDVQLRYLCRLQSASSVLFPFILRAQIVL